MSIPKERKAIVAKMKTSLATGAAFAGVVKVEEARKLLAESRDVDEIKSLRDKALALQAYFRQAEASREAQNDAAEIKIRAERRLGELIGNEDRRGGKSKSQPVTSIGKSKSRDVTSKRGGSSVPLPEGVTPMQAKRWRETAAIPDSKFEAFLREQKDAEGGEVTTAGLHRAAKAEAMGVHFSSATDEWATPPDLFEALNSVWRFDLDVCATAKNAKCSRFFTREQDGLAQAWNGVCWMNPPYGDEIGKWVEKAAKVGHAETVCALLPARTDTAWWHRFVQTSGRFTFIRGRLRFGGAENSAPFPSAIVIFAPGHRGWAPELPDLDQRDARFVAARLRDDIGEPPKKRRLAEEIQEEP